MRRILAFAALLILCAAGVSAQQPQQILSFDVASVKTAGPLDPQKMISGQRRVGMKMDAGRVDIESLALADLINIAFKTKAYQSGPVLRLPLRRACTPADPWRIGGIRHRRADGGSVAKMPEHLHERGELRFQLPIPAFRAPLRQSMDRTGMFRHRRHPTQL